MLDEMAGMSIDNLFDRKTGRYFFPYNPIYGETAELLNEVRRQGIEPMLTTALLDTGVMSHHPLVQGRIVDAVDFTGEGTEDLSGHGTTVALILCMSPVARLFNVKILERDGSGTEGNLIAGLEWAVDHKATFINISAGVERTPPCDGTCRICNAARRIKGKYPVEISVAAGNRPGAAFCPGASGAVTIIGATDYSGGRVAEYSATGDMYVPGDVALLSMEPLTEISEVLAQYGVSVVVEASVGRALGWTEGDEAVVGKESGLKGKDFERRASLVEKAGGQRILLYLAITLKGETRELMFCATPPGVLEDVLFRGSDRSWGNIPDLEPFHPKFKEEVEFWRRRLLRS